MMISTEVSYVSPGELNHGVNPLQRVLAEAMSRAGMPYGARGSQAELSRRSGVSQGIISYIFVRPAYLPDEEHRAALAKALGIPKNDLDQAGAAIKGLRAHASGSEALRQLADVRATIVMSESEMTPAELKRVKKQLDRLADEVAERLRGDRPEG